MSPLAPRSSRCLTAAGTRSRRSKRSRIARASPNVDASGAVGPEPMTSRGSPITSDRSRAMTRAGAAARASWPPLNTEQCFRTALSWLMSAPAASRSRVTACLSASVMGGAGAGVNAEAPPEMSTSTRSRSPALRASARISRAAARPRSSGTGCPASASRIRRVGARWPSFTTTRPSLARSPHASSTAAAIAPEAFPAPRTSRRPTGGRRLPSALRTRGLTWAAASAASKMPRASARGFTGRASGVAGRPRRACRQSRGNRRGSSCDPARDAHRRTSPAPSLPGCLSSRSSLDDRLREAADSLGDHAALGSAV